MRVTLYFVGFYSAHEPNAIQRWRPKEEDVELCSRTEADKRFTYLEREMKARRKVDGLRVASIAIFTEHGDAIKAMTLVGRNPGAHDHERAPDTDISVYLTRPLPK